MEDGKVLVVGGAGYIGSHMVKDLLDTGHDVVTLDDLSTGHRELVVGGEFIEGGLGDAVLLDKLFSIHRISAVMHFAAFSLVGESVEQPLKYYRNNMAATAELLVSMIRHNVKRFIFSSTAAVSVASAASSDEGALSQATINANSERDKKRTTSFFILSVFWIVINSIN